ncbi:hydantoinase/oxoprolinase family protein [Paraburkholderia nemoris]|uniref:hydantoinase/oxoprolinase N-terminal domain-containing protein n=1 Tax=Paraburkholderia nemoris TaxID=2793076 RepID=UPI0038BE0381
MTDYRIGVDVGGTNTDAVLMQGRTVVAALKMPTTEDIGQGLADAIRELLRTSGIAAAHVGSVMVGTTQFINAFLQRKNLSEVAVIRLSMPKTDGVPPMLAWPDDVKLAVGDHVYMALGGALYTGALYREPDADELRAIASDIRAKGIPSVAITSNFAPIRPDIEQRAAGILRESLGPNVEITLSADIGGMGLIDRENATIVNASLRLFSRRAIQSMERAFHSLGLDAPLYISQNDGTLISTETASAYPIFTCAAGPTNSIRGAAFLTGIDDALVVDVGGTTSDIGVLVRGFPRETALPNEIGGVRTNFRMPDILSIAIGGGSMVGGSADAVSVGPESVGYRIRQEALIFGGSTLTATDIAVRCGRAQVGEPARVGHVDEALARAAMQRITEDVECAIDRMRTSDVPLPVILVGGGSVLLPDTLRGASCVIRPENAGVANAIGAAIAQVSGRVDRLYDFAGLGREAALAQARQDAADDAVACGADAASVEIIEIVELPMTHMNVGSVRVKVRAVGYLVGLGLELSEATKPVEPAESVQEQTC